MILLPQPLSALGASRSPQRPDDSRHENSGFGARARGNVFVPSLEMAEMLGMRDFRPQGRHRGASSESVANQATGRNGPGAFTAAAAQQLHRPNTCEVCDNFTKIGADLMANTWRPVVARSCKGADGVKRDR